MTWQWSGRDIYRTHTEYGDNYWDHNHNSDKGGGREIQIKGGEKGERAERESVCMRGEKRARTGER